MLTDSFDNGMVPFNKGSLKNVVYVYSAQFRISTFILPLEEPTLRALQPPHNTQVPFRFMTRKPPRAPATHSTPNLTF